MDTFCNSPFWDANVTWHTEDPKFTPCFEATALSWIPCIFLWIFSPLAVRNLIKRQTWTVPWSWLNITKFFLTVVLILISLLDLSYSLILLLKGAETYAVDYVTPCVHLVTFILAAALLIGNKIRGVSSSAILFLFWFFLVICGAPHYKTELNRAFNKEFSNLSIVPFVSYMMYYPCVLGLFFLNFFADRLPASPSYSLKEKISPYSQASFPSLVFFAWFDTLAWKGYRRQLVPKDLWNLAEEDTVSGIAPKFERTRRRLTRKVPSIPAEPKLESRGVNGIELKPSSEVVSQKEVPPSIWIPIVRAFWPSVLFGFALKFMNDALTFVSPQVLKFLINFMQSEEETWHGYLYAVLLLMIAAFQTLFLAHYFNQMRMTGLRIRIALISAIYRKALKISSASRKASTVGEIVNLMSVDAQRFVDLMPHMSLLWSAPLQIMLAVYFLWDILGASVFAGLGVMILVILINLPIAAKSERLQMKQMKYKDERIKLMNEILSGIKVLKLYAWEDSFEKYVTKIRKKEVKNLNRLAFLGAATAFLWSCAPLLVALTTFGVYLFVDSEHTLNAERTFVTLSLFNILKFPLILLPMLISNIIQTSVSVRRINKFVNSDELDPNCVSHDPTEKDPLVIEEGNFSWGGSALILHDLNIRVAENSLVAIVGSVGCGKSSLLSAFLGEMHRVSGRVNTKGSIAYVTQQAWIQNATLRDNILFGKEFDKKLYDRVVKACALKNDLELLPAGDETEIGEKGINLSGGQKQRVSLARAVYSDADTYFLDDPLSAVDSHVGKHIFENVIGPSGLLKNKTRVLVTHGLTYLSDVHEIYVLKGGKISERGTFKQLMESKGAFAEFLQNYLQECENENDEEVADAKEISRPASPAVLKLSKDVSSPPSPVLLRRRRSLSASEKGSTLSLRQFSKEDDTPYVSVIEKGKKIIEEEIAMTGTVKWEVFAHYFGAMGWAFGIGALAFTFLFQFFAVSSNLWLSEWTSRNNTGSDGKQDPDQRNLFLEVYGALGLLAGLCAIVADLSPRIGCVRASRLLHGSLLRSLLRAPLTFTDTTPTGRILSRFSKDIDVMDSQLPIELADTLYCVMEVLSVIFIISYSTPIFLWCILPLLIFYYLLQRFYTATSRQLQRMESISRSPIFSHFGETVAGAQVIRAYGATNRFILESDKRIDRNQICYHPTMISVRWLSIRLESIGNMIIFFAAFFAVLKRDKLSDSAGLVGLSVTYALQVTGALNWFVRMASSVETNVVAVERVKEYIEIKEEAKWEIAATAPPDDWPQKGKIVFDNFKVRYRSELDLVLKGLTFTVNEQEKVGIVGRTGAGKSSLTLSLFRIIEAAEGAIYIDGIDISTLGLHSLRSKLTIIPQDPVLFSGSLRMNLDPLGIYPDSKIWHALELSHLKDFAKSQPAGLQHEIAEGGENLSVGQRQLICLARALLRKTKVLVLDEATAAVDVETDDLIQSTIRTEFRDCTILTIAHRLNTIMDSDRVLVLDNGQVLEYEAPSSLLKRPNSAFYSMVKDAGLDIENILTTQSANAQR